VTDLHGTQNTVSAATITWPKSRQFVGGQPGHDLDDWFQAERELEPGGRCERGPIMRSTCRSLKERLRVSPAGHCNHVVPHESAGLVRFQSIARSRAPPLALRRNHRSLVNLNVGPATPLRYAIWNPGLSRVCIRPASTAIASGLVQTLTGT